MSFARTVFLREGLPTVDEYGLFRGTLWLTVRFLNKDRHCSDNALMDLTIQRLQAGEFTVDSEPIHQGRGFAYHFQSQFTALAAANVLPSL
ncbi:hypothetical protein N7491_006455 [Penicillium cf. griseofulvum]|nr:hypothetical protein N7491_006455 [Penicillium cf. griseofulvum]